MSAHHIVLVFVSFSLLVSAELRVAVQDDGRKWYSVLVSLSFVDDPAPRRTPLPELVREDPISLSLREAMYLRNRLEEILDDDDEQDEEPVETPADPEDGPAAPAP